MSDWDKKADEGAIKHYSDWCPEGTLESHRRGAKWQRDQLRTPEAVERVANVLADVTGEPRAGRFERTMAPAVIRELLGEEPRR